MPSVPADRGGPPLPSALPRQLPGPLPDPRPRRPRGLRPGEPPPTPRRAPAHLAFAGLGRGLALAFAALLLAAAGAFAQPTAEGVDARLDAMRAEVDRIQKGLDGEPGDEALQDLLGSALATQAAADKIADELSPTLKNVEARLGEIGPGPAGRGSAEAPDIAEQRSNLEKSRKTLDAQVKLARLLAVEGQQAAEQITQLRRARFNARLGERTASILSSRFWFELRDSLPRDAVRLRQLGTDLGTAAAATPLGVWAMLALGAALAASLRTFSARWAIAIVSTRVPPGRLRRSLLALSLALMSLLGFGFAAHFLRLGFTWTAPPPEPVQALLNSAVGLVCFCAYVEGAGRALLSARRPSWRLPPLYDTVAQGLRHYPLLLATVTGVGWIAERIAATVNAGLATAVAINDLVALSLGLVIAQALRRGEMLRRAARAALSDGAAQPSSWVWIGALGLWLAVVAALACLLVGYVALGAFVVKQVAWIASVGATVYLVNAVIDDALMTWAGNRGSDAGEHLPKLRDQAAVLFSALLRLAVLMFGLIAIVAPFGQGPEELLQRTDRLREGLAIGEIRLQPGTVLQGLVVFVLGIVCVRLLQRWLADRYLPTTGLDTGMRESATTLLGYVGSVVAVALALSAVGLGLERIAWVASALSVGIGFGLQAVVQNFVSGLILLAERPVKVGDWVTLPGVDGDIRRINVRATEIQMSDRSTVIVPNSEFITKIVRNVTHASPLGLVQIKLPVPLDTDAEAVRTLMLAAFAAHEHVLESPAPNVFLDGIDGGRLVFNATGSVASPRLAYATKSALLFEILKQLKEAGLPLAAEPTMLLREVPVAPVGAPPAAG